MNKTEMYIAEKSPEHIPTPEEIQKVFKELVGDKEYQEVRRKEDEKGLYLLEITIPGESASEMTEYAYMRQGEYKEGSSATTEVYVTHYDDGQPISGTSAARCIEGSWKIL